MARPISTIAGRDQPREIIVTLQVLRGIAAMLVVFAHSIDYQQMFVPGQSAVTHFYSLENFGAVGVDLFFVISGFIMAVIRPEGGDDRAAFRFAAKRIVRIAPAYWLLTAITALLAHGSGMAITLPRLIASFTFIPLYPHGIFLPPILLIGWSLSFEMYFYLLITASLVIFKRGSAVRFVACLFAVCSVAGICLTPHGCFAAFALSPLLGEFAIGCLIGHLYRNRRADLPIAVASFLLLCGVIGLVATIILGFGSISEMDATLMGYAGAARLLLWGLPSGLIVAGLVGSERRVRSLVPSAMLLVGDASYSIYLIQLLAIKQFSMRWSVAGFGHPDLFIPVAVLFTMLAGIAHYGIVERPLTNHLSNRVTRLLSPPRGRGVERRIAQPAPTHRSNAGSPLVASNLTHQVVHATSTVP